MALANAPSVRWAASNPRRLRIGCRWRINSSPPCEGKNRCRALRMRFSSLSEKASKRKKRASVSGSAIVVEPDDITMEEAREAGPVHAGHQMWHQLGIDAILHRAGLSERACTLTEAMTLNRLICPLSEHAMPDWIRRTALGDILTEDFSKLDDDALYRNLDRLHPNREHIERELAEREKTRFNLDETV